MTSTKCSRHAILREENRNPSNTAHRRKDVCHGVLRAVTDAREGQFLLEAFHTDQIGMNSNSWGCCMRSYPGRSLPQPEHLGLLLALGMTLAMMRIEAPVPLKLTEW